MVNNGVTAVSVQPVTATEDEAYGSFGGVVSSQELHVGEGAPAAPQLHALSESDAPFHGLC
jgi:hypothetical protein